MLEMRKLRNEWVHMAYMENGAPTYRTTGSACLDLFGTIGAMQNAKEEEICVRFLEAYLEDPDLAMKILFFARDVRGGMGERRVFRVIPSGSWPAWNPERWRKTSTSSRNMADTTTCSA